jgi:pilus assembly protein CpaB
MNTPRLIVLGLAALAAGGAAFLARGLLGGGTSHSVAAPTPPPVSTLEVMVAASDIAPGQKLTPELVRWQKWPSSSIDPSFITGTNDTNTEEAVKGTVVRSPVVAGQPLTTLNVIHADSASFMSATLMPGMRAVAITVSVASVAGGFILPNDRVDLVLTQQLPDGHRFRSATILHDVRVLAIDQAAQDTGKQAKAQKAVSDVKTATLELAPEQAEKVTRAQASGTLSLLLRPLVDKSADLKGNARVAAARQRYKNADSSEGGDVSVIRYGVHGSDTTAKGE